MNCTLCGRAPLETVVTIDAVPVHVGRLWPTADSAADAPTGPVDLGVCPACGFVYNAAFDPGLVDYEGSYDNALHHSDVFLAYEDELVERLLAAHDLADGLVVEVGCGPGHFLGLVCGRAGARGIGFDPSHEPEFRDPLADERVRIERGLLEPGSGLGADLVVARHVLEHVADPGALLASLRDALGPGGAIYVEVPNANFLLRDGSLWDVIYEHCGYFRPETLAWAAQQAGFRDVEVASAYEGQFLGLTARVGEAAGAPVDPDAARAVEEARRFGDLFRGQREAWGNALQARLDDGERVVVWGAGAKAVSFLNLLPRADEIACLVDRNPRKQGTHLAGMGTPILAPERLGEVGADTVVVMNPAYTEEITADLVGLGIDADVVVARPLDPADAEVVA